MEDTCQMEPKDKKGYIEELGKILIKEHGKKKFYKPEEVKKAHQNSAWSYMDFSCWGMSVFSSHSEFDTYHRETGESCDYVEMKSEMLEGLSLSASGSWLDITDLDIDASWIDLGSMSEGELGGIGEFFSALFDSVS